MKKFILAFALIICCSLAYTQITIHQYRKVAPENMAEYLDREVKYWSVFAENEVKKGNLTFWAVLQKVGGINQENAPNILLINTFNNLDEPVNWSAVDDLFPDHRDNDLSYEKPDQVENHISIDHPERHQYQEYTEHHIDQTIL